MGRQGGKEATYSQRLFLSMFFQRRRSFCYSALADCKVEGGWLLGASRVCPREERCELLKKGGSGRVIGTLFAHKPAWSQSTCAYLSVHGPPTRRWSPHGFHLAWMGRHGEKLGRERAPFGAFCKRSIRQLKNAYCDGRRERDGNTGAALRWPIELEEMEANCCTSGITFPATNPPPSNARLPLFITYA